MRFRFLFSALFSALLALTVLLSGCATRSGGEFTSVVSAPMNPKAVRVRVSLSNRAVYVMEGDRPLLVTPVAIGKPGSMTPTGQFTVFHKEAKKRSGTYGFQVRGPEILKGERRNTPGGYRYVGYPMPWWVEFSPGYGFHAGSVWPEPRTHGCLRLHQNVAPAFFSLVSRGTPVLIARSLPEDVTLGKNLNRPTDYADPDPPAAYLISDAAFSDLMGKHLVRR